MSENLERAWRHARGRGRASRSPEIRQEIAGFEHRASSTLRSIADSLRRETFRFEPCTPVVKTSKSKSRRPIEVAVLKDRIVQRAILQVLQDDSALDQLHRSPSSYGARGVPSALAEVYELTRKDAFRYFMRSDIIRFFSRIPHKVPVEAIAEFVDPTFAELIDWATEVDLRNAEELGEDRHLFPDAEHGVAQGGSLSAFLGDVLLRTFDLELNARGIRCIRYVDDFVLLGRRRGAVEKAFGRALDMLGRYGLSAYDPHQEPTKANEGMTADGWSFLGCDLSPGIIKPSDPAKRALLAAVEARLNSSEATMADPRRAASIRESFAECLASVGRMIRGWGDHYQFRNDQSFERLDRTIDRLLDRYKQRYRARARNLSPTDRRRILGVQLLSDCKKAPIAVAPSLRAIARGGPTMAAS